ncbi:BspA family leucine-rich repeat surface protein [Bifidobacterium sp. ESL0775]|uniref:BspA family leucine-rich repeat surface protein n=1 Tax=Bifidobacterium sp. ESL0775 TaxID=2983230 RepID=UPI0023F99A4E|nr:BspA family leucine-rich repeat surface protein [Bifidobacterium sp. ESL0775]WEV69840.1 BspA family leucine-rich repeat surface protein [Bifidobacterium sp. ESL0775]
MTRGGPSVGPQSGCAARAGTWGAAGWDFGADCTLTIHGGDTGSTPSSTPFGTGSTSGTIANTAVSVAVDGNLTINSQSAFDSWTSLRRLTTAPAGHLKLTGPAGYRMFAYDAALTTLDATGWDTSQTTSTWGMFSNCTQLASLVLSGWDLTGIRGDNGMSYMFSSDPSLTTIGTHGWKIDDHTTWCLPGAFQSAINLKAIDVSGWDLSGATSLKKLLYGCAKLTSITGLDTWTTTSITNMESLFDGCAKLTSIDVSHFDTHNTNNMSAMFNGCARLATIPGLGTRDTTSLASISGMFNGCASLTSLDLSGWDMRALRYAENPFTGATSLDTLDTHGWTVSNTTIGALASGQSFKSAPNLWTIDVSGWRNTETLSSLAGLFDGCAKLTSITGLDTWTTTNVTSMDYMFRNCPNLAVFDLSSFDISHVLYMRSMFKGDTNLKSLDLSGWDTGHLPNFGVSNLLPSGLRMLALGPNTRLQDQAITISGTTWPNSFYSVNQNINWMQTVSFDLGTAVVGTVGLTPALASKAGTNPAGFYIDEKYVGADLVVDANGGAGSYSREYSTWDTAQTVSAPAANRLTGHKPHAVFAGWNTCRQGGTTGGCVQYAPGETIKDLGLREYFPEQTITIYAQWRTLTAPTGLQAKCHKSTGVDITGTSTTSDTVSACLTAGDCVDATRDGAAWDAGFTASRFTTRYPIGSPYRVTARTSAHDDTTNTTVTSPDSVLQGTLDYTTTTLATDGGTGNVPAIPAVLTDSDTDQADVTLPKLALTSDGGLAYAGHLLAGWHHLTGKTTPEYNTPGTVSIPTTDGTTTNGHTSVTLHPVWATISTPAFTTVGRQAGDNRIAATGTALPWTSADTIKVCIKPTGSPGTPDCQTATWTPSSSGWNGTDSHTWSYTFPRSTTLDKAGGYDLTATLVTNDAWRTSTTTVNSQDATAPNTRISGLYTSSLPLTGGQPQRLAAFLAAGLGLALLLLAAANWLRHQRQAKARHSR